MESKHIFYDGALRPLEDAVRLVSADIGTFLRNRVHDHERSGRAWRVLLAHHRLEEPRSDAPARCSADVCSFELAPETLVITPMHHFRHHLDAIHRTLSEAPWCDHATLEAPADPWSSGRICIPFRSLRVPEEEARQIAENIRAEADGMRQEIRRGVDALCSVVLPEVPAGAAERDPALLAVDAAERGKLRLLELSSRRKA